jgi:uncharacterized protein (TIGR02996 family)
MSYRQAFLRDILDHPDDDVPRRVFADWLDEHGEADRAEFIRAQVRLSTVPEGAGERLELGRRERQLLREHRDRWLAPLRGLVRDAHFRRGFVESAQFDAETFLDHGDEVFAREPVRGVSFLERPAGTLTQIAGSPHLARLHTLDLRNYRANGHVTGLRVSAAEMIALAAAPAVAGLRTLDLGSCLLGADGVGALARSPHLTGLEHLRLGHARVGDAGVEVLAASPRRRLRTLDLGHDGIGPAGARALAAAPGLAGLTALGLGGNDLEDEGVLALAGSPHLGGLGRLDLHGNNCSARGRQALLARFGAHVCRW